MQDPRITAQTSAKFRQITLAALFAVMPFSALAESWQALDATGISEALTDQKVRYQNATQDFRASGKTLYTTSEDSWGNWSLRGDQYCSQWPPSATWNCFNVLLSPDGRKVRFVGQNQDVTDGTFID